MKKRSIGSPATSGKSISAKKKTSLRSRSKDWVQSPQSAQCREVSSLDVITILPPEKGEPPISTAVELKRMRFSYFAPHAREMCVVGSFNHWNPRATPMKVDATGEWSVEVQLPPGEYRYRFMVDGDWRDDPLAQLTVMNAYGSFDAVVVV